MNEDVKGEVKKKTPRDFFLYLFATGSLYFIAVNFITLLWGFVDRFFPDPLRYFDYTFGAMRWAVSGLIILFPAFVWTMRFLNKDLDKHPEKKEMGIRRWLLYLTLFLSAVTIIVDLVVLVYNLLGGDFTARFVLKSLSVLFVAAAIFAYYLFILKRQPGAARSARSLIAWIASIVVFLAVAGAFFVVGGPAQNRARANDQRRIGDLQTIQWQVVNYWQQKQFLPASLKELEDPISGFVLPKDPESGAEYEYSASEQDLSFYLCAEFSLESLGVAESQAKPLPARFDYETPQYWKHSKGRTCFTRIIDPDLYPPFKPLR